MIMHRLTNIHRTVAHTGWFARMTAKILNGTDTVDRIEIQIRDFETNMELLGECLSTSLVNLY